MPLGRGRELTTRAGSIVRLEVDARGVRWVACDGCRRREIVTGLGAPRVQAQRHARTCRR